MDSRNWVNFRVLKNSLYVYDWLTFQPNQQDNRACWTLHIQFIIFSVSESSCGARSPPYETVQHDSRTRPSPSKKQKKTQIESAWISIFFFWKNLLMYDNSETSLPGWWCRQITRTIKKSPHDTFDLCARRNISKSTWKQNIYSISSTFEQEMPLRKDFESQIMAARSSIVNKNKKNIIK